MSSRSLKIRDKLGLVFAFLLLMIVMTIGLGMYSTHKMNESLAQIAKGSFAKTIYAAHASRAVDDVAGALRIMVLLKDDGAIAKEKEKIAEARGRYKESMKNLSALERSEKGKALIEDVKASLGPAVAINNRVMAFVTAHNNEDAAVLLVREGVAATQKVQDRFDAQLKFQQDNADASYEEAAAFFKTIKKVQLGAGLLSIALGLITALALLKNLVPRINRVADAMSRVAEGDFSTRLTIHADDEIGALGDSINRTIDSVGRMVADIKNTSAEVASSASLLSAVSQQIADSSEGAASQISGVFTASEEMSATASDIACNCTLAGEGAEEACSVASSGVSVVAETVAGMGRIAAQVKEAAQAIERLGTSSEHIGEIIETIEDIADQTNLLALNAAIEAARAGDQGRGFAVVADEVRKLASRTTEATKEISGMIKGIQKETKVAVCTMERGVEEVEKGTSDAANSGAALQSILAKITTSTGQIHQIATAAEQQTATTSEIAYNLQQVTDVVSLSASCAHDSAEAADALKGHADELQRLVSRFTLAS